MSGDRPITTSSGVCDLCEETRHAIGCQDRDPSAVEEFLDLGHQDRELRARIYVASVAKCRAKEAAIGLRRGGSVIRALQDNELRAELSLRALMPAQDKDGAYLVESFWRVHEDTIFGATRYHVAYCGGLHVRQNSYGKFALLGINGGGDGYQELRVGYDVFATEAEARASAAARKSEKVAKLREDLEKTEKEPVR